MDRLNKNEDHNKTNKPMAAEITRERRYLVNQDASTLFAEVYFRTSTSSDMVFVDGVNNSVNKAFVTVCQIIALLIAIKCWGHCRPTTVLYHNTRWKPNVIITGLPEIPETDDATAFSE